MGLVIFDGDDTLWQVEQLYDAALREAERVVDAAGLPGAEWRQLQRQYDLRNVTSLGMSPERFPLSSRQALIETAKIYGRELQGDLVERVVAISRSVFTQRATVQDAAKIVLTALRPVFRLALLTKGDPAIQHRRIAESGLVDLFERVQIVDEKSESVFRETVSAFNVQPDCAWSVGNSLPSDINPALRAGLNAIWIDAHVWEHERREVHAADSRVIVLGSLDHLPELLLTSLIGTGLREDRDGQPQIQY